jgi:transcription termination/antitermination protein NusG
VDKQVTVRWESSSGAVFSSHSISWPQTPETESYQSGEPQWYAIQTRYRVERKVTTQLQQKGFETFLPVLHEIHRWSDRQKNVAVPLFSGYTFARLDLFSDVRLEVLRTQGVIRLVSFGKGYVSIPAKQVDDLQRLLSRGIPCAVRAFLRAGQKVRIRGGCLDGLEGILQQDDGKSLIISIEPVQKSIAIKIEGYDLELI